MSITLVAIFTEIQLFDKVSPSIWTFYFFLVKNSLCSLIINYLRFLQYSLFAGVPNKANSFISCYCKNRVNLYKEFYNFVFKENDVLFWMY